MVEGKVDCRWVGKHSQRQERLGESKVVLTRSCLERWVIKREREKQVQHLDTKSAKDTKEGLSNYAEDSTERSLWGKGSLALG